MILKQNDNATDLLLFSTSHGDLLHFSEKIPSVDDIFIKAVQQNLTSKSIIHASIDYLQGIFE